MDPEDAHDRALRALAWLSTNPRFLALTARICSRRDHRLEVRRFGLSFPNPVGLAAGFDKDASAPCAWPALGFGHAEIGTVTASAQSGNPRPRMFRLARDEALVNRMGFNNQGSEKVAQRLGELGERRKALLMGAPLGVNIGKSFSADLKDAPLDYRRSLERLWPYGDYFVVNVSSPNTPGLRELQSRDQLDELLAALSDFADELAARIPPRRPLLVKVAPDLTWPQLDDVLDVATNRNVAGIVAVNTTLSRPVLRTPSNEQGGLSGRPLAKRSVEVLRYARRHVGDRLTIVSCGGIFSGDDVYERLRLGASLVQLYTAFVYQGPLLLKEIHTRLLALLERDGVPDVASVIGADDVQRR